MGTLEKGDGGVSDFENLGDVSWGGEGGVGFPKEHEKNVWLRRLSGEPSREGKGKHGGMKGSHGFTEHLGGNFLMGEWIKR